MKMKTLLVIGAGALIGGILLYKVVASRQAAVPQQVAKIYRIPTPGAGAAEQLFPNIHKFGLEAPFYTAPSGSQPQYSNGNLIIVD